MTDISRVGDSGISTVEGLVAGEQAIKYAKEREKEKLKYENIKNKIKEQNNVRLENIHDKFKSER